MGKEDPAGADLSHYIEPYRRRRWLVLGILILLPAAVYGVSKLLPKTYEAETTLLVRATSVSSSVFGNAETITSGSAADTLTLIGTTPVAEEAAKELGDPDAGSAQLLGQVSAGFASAESSEFISITAEDEDPVRAAEIANAFAVAISETRAEETRTEIQKTIRRLGRQADEIEAGDKATEGELSTQLQELRGLLASQRGSTQVIEAANVPASPISPRPARNTALAFLLAVLLAAGAVPLADALNRRLRNPDELESLLGVSMLAQIPERAFPGNVPGNDVRESFQTLRASLTYFNLDRELEIILVTSPGHTEGKTTVSTHLAIAVAREGRDVILVDGDMRKPQAAARLGVDPAPGLEQVLVDDADLDEALQQADIEGGSLRVLGNPGPARNPAILLGSQRMRDLLVRLREKCDLVIVDTPPLLAVSDAIPLLKQASGTILVGKLNHTHTSALSKTQEVIAAAEGTLLGSVATGASSGGLYGYGGYGYGDDGYGDSAEEQAPVAGRRGAEGETDSTGRSLRDRLSRR